MLIASGKRFDRMRQIVNARLFNNTYRIYPYASHITESGAVSGQATLGTPIEYNGLLDIPCRIDVARHVREDDVMGQEAVPGGFELHVPSDAPLKINHAIVIEGRRYEVIKEYDYGTDWSPDKYALVADLRVGEDDA